MRRRMTMEVEVEYTNPRFVYVLCEELRMGGHVLDIAGPDSASTLTIHSMPDEFNDMQGLLLTTILRAQERADAVLAHDSNS